MEVYICLHCDRWNYSLEEHLRHMRHHHGYTRVNIVNAARRDRRYRCRECAAAFISKAAADKHCGQLGVAT